MTADKPRPRRIALVLAAVATAVILALLLVTHCWDEPSPAGECDKPGQACGGAPAHGGPSSTAAAGASGGVAGAGGEPDSST